MALASAKSEGSLPADLTSFVGRRHDRATVRQLLATARLVTLTGLGGVGKTRLALKVAAEMRRAFPDGVFLVELAPLTDPDLLPQAVIDALEIRGQSANDAIAALRRFLHERALLLVLDNCEHLVEAAADLVNDMLCAAPDVRILATSRQALRIAGEHIYPVPPLLAPDPGDFPATGQSSHYPAVALFAERAAAVVPGFAVTPENEAAVVSVCHRLEGIPLAIELASVQLRTLTVEELAARLHDRFQLLRGGHRNRPLRHQTLQSLMDWSYDLCTSIEQLLWIRSSLFADGFTADAAEAVCTDERLPAGELLSTLGHLVDKSIVIREECNGQSRFRMLETLREYGRARLASSGEDAGMARLHRDWYARLIETAGNQWTGRQQERWATRLRLEHANIRVALEYCMSTPGEARTGLQMAAVPWFWGAMDHLTEGQLWLSRGLALDQEPSHERAWALATAAYIACFSGDQLMLMSFSEQARELAASIADPTALAFATHVLAFRESLGNVTGLTSSIPMFARAFKQYTETGIARQYADTLLVELATAHVMLGEYERASEVTDELHGRCDSTGERWNLSYALWLRGLLALINGNPQRAERELGEALRIKRVFHDTLGIGLTLEVAAWTAAVGGEPERAAFLFGSTDRIWGTLGARLLRRKRGRYEAMARSAIGTTRFEAAAARGARVGVAEALAFALREHVDEPVVVPIESATGLTPRETEVARLVAEGLSNKEIAVKLVISPRTAEGHVENILAKQGFTRRAQIASWVTRQQVDPA